MTVLSREEGKAALGKKRGKGEHNLQSSIMRFLDDALPSSCYAFAVPNGGKRNAVTGAILKREGVKAGVADIMILRNPGMCAMIEVKTKEGGLSNSQKLFRDWCSANGFPYAVVRSLGDVECALLDWGIPLSMRLSA